ncbi:protein of unknown function [Xenorhabdus poinarii G6]|uniref:Uncharacterized protein n=1 Tax=Xenorhabdus poinarii G6 TaxID=1354304 RepID=A0A068R410_9GAMM|nr:protein of unknown function [Xenorhabdus poinarii G6]
MINGGNGFPHARELLKKRLRKKANNPINFNVGMLLPYSGQQSMISKNSQHLLDVNSLARLIIR